MHDVIVVGAGPVGATLALSLADSGLDIVVLDARGRGESARSDRSLALSHGARLIFERLGVWCDLARDRDAATPITRIDVSQAGGFGGLQLTAAEHGLPALGYVVRYRALQAALDAALARVCAPAGRCAPSAQGGAIRAWGGPARSCVTLRHGHVVRAVGGTSAYAAVMLDDPGAQPMLARLAAVADGSGAAIAGLARVTHDYQQVALAARIRRAEAHCGVAYERFTPDGPVALLPDGIDYALVWTVASERAQRLLELSDAAFLAELTERFGPRVGGLDAVSARRTFPLTLEFARVPVATRCVALGNAAQTLHPVAGQGFNVGLRDAFELAQIIADSPRSALGSRAMLDRYRTDRRFDRSAGIAFTHALVRIFGSDVPFVRWSRGLALTLLATLPVAKHAFTRAMLFGLR
jgi:2-octaprenyl-6-methoxyphenol hydroxylase